MWALGAVQPLVAHAHPTPPPAGDFVADGTISLAAPLSAILEVKADAGDEEGGEEELDPPLVDAGYAHEVLLGMVGK